jgi:hypothetical protein
VGRSILICSVGRSSELLLRFIEAKRATTFSGTLALALWRLLRDADGYQTTPASRSAIVAQNRMKITAPTPAPTVRTK